MFSDFRNVSAAALAVTLFIATGCTPDVTAGPQALDNPAGSNSRYPHVASTTDGTIYMSWLQAVADDATAVMVARFDGVQWSPPVRVTAGTNLFINWADFPAVSEYRPGHLLVHWLERSAAKPYAYDVRVAISADAGVTWSAPLTPHTDGTTTEHGFVSHIPGADGPGLIWLDGRRTATGGAMQLRYAALDDNGRIVNEDILDERVCDCCQTAAGRLDDRLIAAYRDRSLTEVRDIAVTIQSDAGWAAPFVVAPDGWRIDGCPVNGPALDVSGSAVAVAWYTEANDKPAVRLARSTDRANSFRETTLELSAEPLGRVDVLMLDDGEIAVSWLERTANGAAIKLRRFDLHGRPGPQIEVAAVGANRASGFARMARAGKRLVIAWTDTSGDQPTVRSAIVGLDDLARR